MLYSLTIQRDTEREFIVLHIIPQIFSHLFVYSSSHIQHLSLDYESLITGLPPLDIETLWIYRPRYATELRGVK